MAQIQSGESLGSNGAAVQGVPTESEFDQRKIVDVIAEGDALSEKGRYRSAIRTWRSLLEGDQQSGAEERKRIQERIAAAYFSRSQLSLKGKGSKKALGRGMARLEDALRWDGEKAEYVFEMGKCYLRLGDVQQAAAYFQQALDCRGATPVMRYYCALAKVRSGDAHGAIKLLDRGTPTSGETAIPPGYWTRLKALAVSLVGRVDEGLSLLQFRPEGISQDVWVNDVHSLVFATHPSTDTCQKLAEIHRLLEQDGANPEAVKTARILGDLYAALDHDEEAVAHWLAAKADRGSVPDGGKVLGTCERQALHHLKNLEFDQAEEWCRRGLQAEEGDPVLTELLGVVHLTQGNAAWVRDDKDEALDAWRRSLMVQPSIAAAWNVAVGLEACDDWKTSAGAWGDLFNLKLKEDESQITATAGLRQGLALLRAGDPGGAAAALRKSLGPKPDGDGYRLLGLLLLEAGQYQEAVDAFENGIEKCEGDGVTALGLAMASDLADSRLETKVDHWRRAVQLTGEDAARRRWRRQTLELGMGAWQAEEFPRAMRIFASLLLEDSNDVDGWIWCGMLHLQQESESQASDCFKEAVRIDPTSSETLIKLGGCYLTSGRQEEAEDYFAKASSMSPFPHIKLRIAEVCVEVNRDDLAFDHLSEGVKLCERSAPELYKILRLLVQLGEGDRIRPLLDEALQVASKPYQIRMLVAVQHLRDSEWRSAQESLNEVAEEARAVGDRAMLADIDYFSRALILFMTVGTVDKADFDQRVAAMVERWVDEHAPEESVVNIEAEWRRRARQELDHYLQGEFDQPDIKRSGIDLSTPRLSVSLPRFNQPLDLNQLLGRDVEVVEST